MKTIVPKYGYSPIAKMTICEAELDGLFRQRAQMQELCATVGKGELSENLYDFLNLDGSLETLFGFLPRPNDGLACEALASSQCAHIEAALELNWTKIKETLKSWWEAFKEWWLDMWDTSRNLRIRMRKHLAELKSNPETYASETSFGKIDTRVISHPNWELLVKAAEGLVGIVSQIPQDKVDEWMTNNRDTINKYLLEFGQNMDEKHRTHSGRPKYEKDNLTLSAARWRKNLMVQDVEKSIKLLDSDIKTREAFNKLESICKKAMKEADKIDEFRNIVVFVKRVKANVFMTVQMVNFILVKAMAAAERSNAY